MQLLKFFHNILLTILLLSAFAVKSQELNCSVVINGDATKITDQAIFREMENAFEQFLNSRQWSDDNFESIERIKCNILITLNQDSEFTNYNASVQIQSARPVYNATYESILLNFADRDWSFNYVEGQPLEYNDNSFFSNLTSMLAFYAYILLGMDYDSFGELGGNLYFAKALNVVNNAQQSNHSGWGPMNSNRNRYWLIENINNQQMQEVRRAFYTYHRHGLDNFYDKPEESRTKAFDLIKEMYEVQKIQPNSILIIALLDAKSNEFINLFSEGDLPLRKQAYEYLINMDPTRKQRYDQIINQ
ncbi:MAG: DUF4835 family protein [Candidatus Cyclobacteriaceae bacterium M2_1C_046]